MARIRGIQRSYSYGYSHQLTTLEAERKKEYQLILAQEEILWENKYRSDWNVDGERNTKFFHLTTLISRNRNRIYRLKIDDIWCTDAGVLQRHVLAFYEEELFPFVPNVTSVFIDGSCPQLSRDEKHMLVAPLSLD